MVAPLPRIKPCPHCGEALWFYYGSDPTWIQWTFWTDGHNTHGFEQDSYCDVRYCNLCRRFFIDDFSASEGADALKALMKMLEEKSCEASVELKQARGEAEVPTVDTIYDAIRAVARTATKEHERALRILAWRMENNRVRALRHRDHPLALAEMNFSSVAIDSLRSLFDLLDPSKEKHRFYRAEIARELGAFDTANELFDAANFTTLRSHAQRAQALARRRDRYVANFGKV